MKEYVINKWVTSTGVPVPEQGESPVYEMGDGRGSGVKGTAHPCQCNRDSLVWLEMFTYRRLLCLNVLSRLQT